ncbi:MAG TPA: Rieske 2Fe-2S domain-containing protein [Polyangiaceae bacterium]
MDRTRARGCRSSTSTTWEGEMVAVRVEGADVLLVRLEGGEVRAYDNRCPHAGSPLSEGRLYAATLTCATHLWEFDARTGDGINPRGCKLRRHPVHVVDGVVRVRLG